MLPLPIWLGLAPPPRVQIFVWCVLKGRVVTRTTLKMRGLLNQEDPICETEEEDVDHLFLHCPLACYLWNNFANLFKVPWVFDRTCAGSLESWFISRLTPRLKLAWNTVPTVILWSIWKERNSRKFEGKSTNLDDLFQVAKWRLCIWLLLAQSLEVLDSLSCYLLGGNA